MGSGVSWPTGLGVFSRREGRSSWRRRRTAQRSGWRGPCGTRVPPPQVPPPPSTSSLCLWLPPSCCLSPAPTFSQVTPKEGPCVGCSSAPRVGTAQCYLGGPGSEQWAGSQGCGPPPWAGGGTPGLASGQRSPPLGSGWRLVTGALSWRLGSEGLCSGALGTIYMTDEKERRQTLPSPSPTPGKRQENQRF